MEERARVARLSRGTTTQGGMSDAEKTPFLVCRGLRGLDRRVVCPHRPAVVLRASTSSRRPARALPPSNRRSTHIALTWARSIPTTLSPSDPGAGRSTGTASRTSSPRRTSCRPTSSTSTRLAARCSARTPRRIHGQCRQRQPDVDAARVGNLNADYPSAFPRSSARSGSSRRSARPSNVVEFRIPG